MVSSACLENRRKIDYDVPRCQLCYCLTQYSMFGILTTNDKNNMCIQRVVSSGSNQRNKNSRSYRWRIVPHGPTGNKLNQKEQGTFRSSTIRSSCGVLITSAFLEPQSCFHYDFRTGARSRQCDPENFPMELQNTLTTWQPLLKSLTQGTSA